MRNYTLQYYTGKHSQINFNKVYISQMHATIHTLYNNRSSIVNEVSMTNSEFFLGKIFATHKKKKQVKTN